MIDLPEVKMIGYFSDCVRPIYKGKNLAYHNWDHVTKVMRNASYLYDYGSSTELELILAILYHDVIYVPGAYTDYNETMSAGLFKRDYDSWVTCLDNGVAVNSEYVQELIKATVVGNHISVDHSPKSVWEAIILDADLSSLADPYPDFVVHQENIAKEHDYVPYETAIEKGKSFLTKFLDPQRKSIYHTPAALELWEDKARINIQLYTR